MKECRLSPKMAHGTRHEAVCRDAASAGRVQGQRTDAAEVLSAAQHCFNDVRLLAARARDEAAETRAAATPGEEVEVAASEAAGQGFTLNLVNGRRIESSWQFAEAELARLIRIAESA